MKVDIHSVNCAIIEFDNIKYLISYNTVIAKKEDGKVTLDEKYWDYSTTTGRHRNMFLRESKKETQKKIDKGEYKLENLNYEI